jgi:hypothetical protein
MIRLLVTSFLAAMLAVPAYADEEQRRRNAAGIVALGLLGAALASRQHDNGRVNRYEPANDYDANENAIGACTHYAERLVRQQGGYDFEVDRIRRVTVSGRNRVVQFDGTGYYNNLRKRSRISCTVRNHTVVGFKYT